MDLDQLDYGSVTQLTWGSYMCVWGAKQLRQATFLAFQDPDAGGVNKFTGGILARNGPFPPRLQGWFSKNETFSDVTRDYGPHAASQ